MPAPQGIISTSTGPVDTDASSEQIIEETTQDIATPEEEAVAESTLVEDNSN